MFGFLFGLGCLAALFYYLKTTSPGGRRRGADFRRRFLLRRVYRTLETTPGQERVIRQAMSDLEEELDALRGHRRELRSELAKVLRGDDASAGELEAVITAHEGALGGLKTRGAKALADVHAALDPYQRRRLSEWLDQGLGYGCGRRSAA